MFERFLKSKPVDTINRDDKINEMMNKLAKGNLSKDELDNISYSLDFEILNRPIQATIIDLPKDKKNDIIIKEIVSYCYQLIDEEEGIVFVDKKNRIVISFFYDVLWEDQVKKILEKINEKILDKYLINPIITVGNLVDNSINFYQTYRCAVGIQDYSIVKKKGKILYYSDIVLRRKLYPEGISFSYNKLYDFIINNNENGLDEYIQDVYSKLSREIDCRPGLVYNFTFELAINVISVIKEVGSNEEELIIDCENLMQQILAFEDIKLMEQWIKDFIHKQKEKVDGVKK